MESNRIWRFLVLVALCTLATCQGKNKNLFLRYLFVETRSVTEVFLKHDFVGILLRKAQLVLYVMLY